MPDLRRRKCKRCRRGDDEAGPISWRGLCLDCGKAAVLDNVEGLMDPGSQPATVAIPRWRLGMIRSAGGIVPDALLASSSSSVDTDAGRMEAPR